jgi:hypothetical protein
MIAEGRGVSRQSAIRYQCLALAGKIVPHGCPAKTIMRALLARIIIAHSWVRRGSSDSFAVGGGDPRQARTGVSPSNRAAHGEADRRR